MIALKLYLFKFFLFVGKTQENLRNRVSVEVLTDRKLALKRVCKPSFKRSQQIHEDLIVMESVIPHIQLNRPIYIGASVLNLSKLLMYEFHYNKMKKWFADIELCFTDTDSLLYHIKGVDVYDVMADHQDEFDLSDYPLDHPLYSTANKKIIGKFKDEMNSVHLLEFVGVLPKCYSLLFAGKVENNTLVDLRLREKSCAKGTKRIVKDVYLTHDRFREVVTDNAIVSVRQNKIQSIKHSLGTYHQTRVSLTPYDTKRWIGPDNIFTRAHGHCATRREVDYMLSDFLDCDMEIEL